MAMVRRPSIQYDARGKIATHGPQAPKFGVWHDTESHDHAGIMDLAGIVAFWHNQGLGYGAHVIIDKDGNSAFCANPWEICWAVQNHNTGAFHVELIGFAKFTPSMWMLRRKQLDKLAKWMAWMSSTYKVPLLWSTEHGWAGHRAHSAKYGGSHYDPGRGFTANWVMKRAIYYREHGW